jgi:hypothetical protein
MRIIFAALIVGLIAFGWFVVRPYLQQEPCPYCGGKAFVMKGIIEIPCPPCRGSGKIAPYQRDEILKLMAQERKEQEEAEKKAAEEAESAPSY